MNEWTRMLANPATRRAVVAAAALGAGVGAAVAVRQSGAAQDATPAASPVAASTGPTPIFRLGIVPAETGDEILRQFQPLEDYLREELEAEEFEIIPGTDYTAVIEAMRGGNLEAAFFGPFSYILAHEIAGAESVAMPGNDAGEPGVYYSLIQANADSGITDLEGLRGRSFSFVDPSSTSGYLIPSSMLVEAGIDTEADLEAIFAGGHDSSLLAINEGRVDAGASSNSQFNSMVEEGLIDAENFVLLQESDPIPVSPFAVRGDLDPGLKERFRQALLSFHEVAGSDVVATITDDEGTRFVDAPDSIYDPLREVVTILDLDLDELGG